MEPKCQWPPRGNTHAPIPIPMHRVPRHSRGATVDREPRPVPDMRKVHQPHASRDDCTTNKIPRARLLQHGQVAMPSFYRPCLECGRLGRGTRCDQHEMEYKQRREAQRDTYARREKKKDLYNWAYQQQRKILRETATHCHICSKPFTDKSQIEADHLIPSDNNSPLAPAHRACNQRRGNKPLR